MSLIGLLIVLLIFCLVVWAARQILAAFAIGPPIATVVQVVIVLIFVLWLIEALGLLPAGPVLRVR
jgi:hypothetical protein